MAFNLSDRIGSKGRIAPDPGAGFRANTADFNFTAAPGDRGSVGDTEGSNKGGPHSSSGFRRALEHTERTAGRLSGDIASRQHFGGQGFKKPSQFAQGGRRHGMHIGAGAPAITPAMDTGSDSGGE
jgi:hypothetical protein